jgi:hypothetical protein
MKKIAAGCLIMMLACFTSANVIVPRAWISEILIDSAGNWAIEMGFADIPSSVFDSVLLVTSSGSSIISFFEVNIDGGMEPFDSLSVITNENLVSPVFINPQGDFVRLVTYLWGNEATDEIVFGNYQGSFLDCIYQGESVVCHDWDEFCIDTSPTIGTKNCDGIGYYGVFSGQVLDPAGIPLTGGYVKIIGNGTLSLSLDSLGYFFEGDLARRYTFDTIKHFHPPWPNNGDIYTVEPVDFCLRPDSSVYQDIICTSLVMGIEEEIPKTESMVVVAPNPFTDHVTFYFKLPGQNKEEEMQLSFYTLEGKMIERMELSASMQKTDWFPESNVPAGVLVYQLEKDGKVVKTGKFTRIK